MIEFYSPFSRKYLILTQTPQTYAEFASRFALAAIRTVHAPTRYKSVGCDDGAFRVPKEY